MEQLMITDKEVSGLFKGWFHNKMTVLLILGQYPGMQAQKGKIDRQVAFLTDLEHHFLRERKADKEAHNAIRWLKAYFQTYTEGVKPERVIVMLEMVRCIYNAFGFHLHWGENENIERLIKS